MNKLRYRCLVVDHDDTVVNSTATIHYPCFTEYVKKFYPNAREYTLEEYFAKNFDPGIVEFFCNEVGMTAEGMKHEEVYWNNYVQSHVPEAYPGIAEVLWEQKKRGGTLCVVSQSYSVNILRDWKANGLPEPDMIYGWEQPADKRKPHTFPLTEIIRRGGFDRRELIMVDDLKPGYDMASACGVDFAAAGWANDIPVIESFMRENCGQYFKTTEQMYRYLFEV